MKTNKKNRIVSLILSVLTVLSCLTVFAFPANATYSDIRVNMAPEPNKGNLTKYALPPTGSPVQGQTYFLNLACTEDWRLDSAQFFVKKPGSTEFISFYTYNPSGYFRWCNSSYTFTLSGVYEFRVTIKTTDGAESSGGVSVYVAPKTQTAEQSTVSNEKVSINWQPSGTSFTRSSDNTFSINGYEITPGSIHKTYYSTGKETTNGDAYYCYYNNTLTYVAGAQCLNYAYYCQLLLFGVDSHTTKLYNSEKNDGISNFYGVRYNRKLTADEYKQLLQYTGVGTHLRCKYQSSTNHSIIVLEVTDVGFYYTDANTSASTYGKNNIKLGYTSFEDFASGNYSYLSYVEYYHD